MAKKKPAGVVESFGDALSREILVKKLRIRRKEKPPEGVLQLAMMDYADFLPKKIEEEVDDISSGIVRQMSKAGHSRTVLNWALFTHCELENLEVYHKVETSYAYVVGYDQGGPEYSHHTEPLPDDPDYDDVCRRDVYLTSRTDRLAPWVEQKREDRKGKNYGIVRSVSVEERTRPKVITSSPKRKRESAMIDIAEILIDLKPLNESVADNPDLDGLIESMAKRYRSNTVRDALREHVNAGRIDLLMMNRLDLGEYTWDSQRGEFDLKLSDEIPAKYRDLEFDRICFGEELEEWCHSKDGDRNESNSDSGTAQESSPDEQQWEDAGVLNLQRNFNTRKVRRKDAEDLGEVKLTEKLWSLLNDVLKDPSKINSDTNNQEKDVLKMAKNRLKNALTPLKITFETGSFELIEK